MACSDTERTPPRADPAPPGAAISFGPFTRILATSTGSFAEGHSWTAEILVSGECKLQVDDGERPLIRNSVLTSTDLDRLNQALRENRFVELPESLGRTVLCGSTRTLTVWSGEQRHSVRMEFPDSLDAEVARRYARTWAAIEAHMTHPDGHRSAPIDAASFGK